MQARAWGDFIMLDWTHSLRSAGLDIFFARITYAGSLYVLLPVSALLGLVLRVNDKVREVQVLFVSLALTVLCAHGAKVFFKRPRPSVHPPLVEMPLDWSFPSAHTAQAACFCLCISFFALRMLPAAWAWTVCLLAMLLAGAVGLSRIYLQVHYPSDVVAGLGLALLAFSLASFLVKT